MDDWLVWGALIIGLLALPFAIGALRGAPYVPTLKRQMEVALDLLNLQPGQILLELGAGDGKVVKAAAARGLHVIAYEINPLLCMIAQMRNGRYHKTVRIYCQDYWQVPLPKCDGVFIFGIARIMPRMGSKLGVELKPGTPVVSFAYTFPGRDIIRKAKGVFLYRF